MLILSREYPTRQESAFFVATAGIIPTKAADSNGRTRQTRTRGVSAMIALSLQPPYREGRADATRTQCGKIILH